MRFLIRKLLVLLLILAFCLPAASCSGAESVNSSGNDTGEPSASSDIKIDYDYAKLDMASQYQKCLSIRTDFGKQDFNKYMGKSVRVTGLYQQSGYHFVVVQDVTLCCYADFEILYDGSYPAAGSEIEVTGVFDSYKDAEGTWPYIKVENMKVLAPPKSA